MSFPHITYATLSRDTYETRYERLLVKAPLSGIYLMRSAWYNCDRPRRYTHLRMCGVTIEPENLKRAGMHRIADGEDAVLRRGYPCPRN